MANINVFSNFVYSGSNVGPTFDVYYTTGSNKFSANYVLSQTNYYTDWLGYPGSQNYFTIVDNTTYIKFVNKNPSGSNEQYITKYPADNDFAPQTGSLATGSIIYLAPSGYDSGSATWYDYSGFGNDAIVSGSNLVSQSNGWEFNGTNNYLVLPTLQSFNVNTNYTYQIFFTVDSSGSQTLFSKTGSYLDFPTQRKETIYNPSYSNCECIGDGAFIDKRRQTSQAQNFANCLVTSSVPSTQCYTWVNSGSMDGCFASGYLGQTTGAVAYQNNARLDFETCLTFCSGTTGNYTYDLGLCQSNIYIGKSYDDSVDKFSGTLRAFVFYNRNLTEAEILSNYNYFSSSFST